LLHVLLRAGPTDTQKDFERTREEIGGYIDQSHHTWLRSRQEAAARAENAFDVWSELLGRLYDPIEGDPLFVPDTNALLWNPGLEDWVFPNAPKFGIVLTATVLSELDKLKIEHRVAEVREKAETLVRRIKGYRTRGPLGDGVPLRRDRTTLRTIALEPDFSDTLPWLDPGNGDDRILATFVEVMRTNSRTQVVLVTRDINLQNKAEYAGLPFIEPPDPPLA
jgi:rRNA-processing protein FCF1